MKPLALSSPWFATILLSTAVGWAQMRVISDQQPLAAFRGTNHKVVSVDLRNNGEHAVGSGLWMVTLQVSATTAVLLYPTNLLRELSTLAGECEGALGLFDQENQLKPLLKKQGVECLDLEEAGLGGFAGRLAIVSPFAANTKMREGLPAQIEKMARIGISEVKPLWGRRVAVHLASCPKSGFGLWRWTSWTKN